MKLKKYLNELSIKKNTDIKIRNASGTTYKAVITLNPELEYPESRWFSFKGRRFDIEDFEDDWGSMSSKTFSKIEDIHGGKSGLNRWTKNIWEVIFSDEDSNTAQYELKDKKLAFQLFAGLQKVMINFLEKYNPDVWYFSAKTKEQSRIKLYNTITKKLKQWYYVDIDNYRSDMLYLFWRKN